MKNLEQNLERSDPEDDLDGSVSESPMEAAKSTDNHDIRQMRVAQYELDGLAEQNPFDALMAAVTADLFVISYSLANEVFFAKLKEKNHEGF